MQTPESFAARFNIEARVRSEVERANPKKKTITVHNLIREDFMKRRMIN